jgi:hypothetical protein
MACAAEAAAYGAGKHLMGPGPDFPNVAGPRCSGQHPGIRPPGGAAATGLAATPASVINCRGRQPHTITHKSPR